MRNLTERQESDLQDRHPFVCVTSTGHEYHLPVIRREPVPSYKASKTYCGRTWVQFDGWPQERRQTDYLCSLCLRAVQRLEARDA